MKKVLLLSLGFVICSIVTNGTVHVVQVSNFQFSPANITNVFVGDIVRFQWVSGNHTTTDDPATEGADNTLPAGAAAWNSPINSANPVFDYTVTVAGVYKYYCIPHKEGMTGEFTASSSLPVKLSSFLVNGANEKVSLSWKTLSEENTDYFSVRRSANGTSFKEIGKVPASGTTTVEKKYSFTDTKISADKKYYYYYIAVIDKDGKEMLSETKLFKNNLAISKLVLTLSPNPISRPGHLMMTFNAAKEGKMEVKVVNAEGKAILTTTMQAFAGVNNGHVHLGNLATGTYSLICTMNGVKETHKVVFR